MSGVAVDSVFISYRRDDTAGYAGRLDEALSTRFGPTRVFRDIDGVRPGVDFTKAIEEAVGRSGAVLALIGRDWLRITDGEGRRRLEDPHDFVRLEIESALERGIAVIPVLLEGVRMPSPKELPESIADLGRRQAIELTESRWQYDIGQLVARLDEILDAPATGSAPDEPATTRAEAGPVVPTAGRRLAKAVVGLVVLAVVSILLKSPEDDPASPAAETTASSVDEEQAAAIDVDKTLWYAGFKVTLTRATLRAVDGERVLQLPVSLENQGDTTTRLDSTIFVTSRGRHHELGSSTDLPNVPGRATGRGMLSFSLGAGGFSLEDAAITFGRSDKSQAVVPLGSVGQSVNLEPLPVTFGARTLSAGAVSLEVRNGEVRGDNPGRGPGGYVQAGRGRRVLVLEFAALSTTDRYGTVIGDSYIVVTLPDGTTVAPDTFGHLAYPDKPVRDVYASFVVNEPAQGAYRLVLKDGQQSSALEFVVA